MVLAGGEVGRQPVEAEQICFQGGGFERRVGGQRKAGLRKQHHYKAGGGRGTPKRWRESHIVAGVESSSTPQKSLPLQGKVP